MKKLVIIGMVAALALMLPGCKNWSNHTTVLGIEVAYNQSEYIPSVRLGYINHDNNGASDAGVANGAASFVWKKYDKVSAISISGTTDTISFTGDTNNPIAQALAQYIIAHQTTISAPSTNKVTFSAVSSQITGTVFESHDGDTCKVKAADGQIYIVRLYGIDAPEYTLPKLNQPYGKESGAYLAGLILNKSVTVEITGKDVHPQRVDGVIMVDGKNVNLEMVKTGYAWAYVAYLKAADKPAYQAAQDDAKSAKLGLWADANPTPPWEYRKAQKTKK